MLFQYIQATNLSGSPCTTNSDIIFGPASDCRYDFTLLFEQCVLSAVPSAVLLLFGGPRIVYLYRQDNKTSPTPIKTIKLVRMARMS